jgi:hydrogenase/urease accessory protein HupE
MVGALIGDSLLGIGTASKVGYVSQELVFPWQLIALGAVATTGKLLPKTIAVGASAVFGMLAGNVQGQEFKFSGANAATILGILISYGMIGLYGIIILQSARKPWLPVAARAVGGLAAAAGLLASLKTVAGG